jgi:hypothetical protein
VIIHLGVMPFNHSRIMVLKIQVVSIKRGIANSNLLPIRIPLSFYTVCGHMNHSSRLSLEKKNVRETYAKDTEVVKIELSLVNNAFHGTL